MSFIHSCTRLAFRCARARRNGVSGGLFSSPDPALNRAHQRHQLRAQSPFHNDVLSLQRRLPKASGASSLVARLRGRCLAMTRHEQRHAQIFGMWRVACGAGPPGGVQGRCGLVIGMRGVARISSLPWAVMSGFLSYCSDVVC